MNVEQIKQVFPPELLALSCWVVWKYEPRSKGKPAKIPYNTRQGKAIYKLKAKSQRKPNMPQGVYPASSSNPKTWGTFKDAASCVGRGFDGIGFMFPDDNSVIGLDFDNKGGDSLLLGNTPSDWLPIIEHCNSYTEASPSHTGLHVLMLNPSKQLPARNKFKLQTGELEVYAARRFFTVTGIVTDGLERLNEVKDFSHLLPDNSHKASIRAGSFKAETPTLAARIDSDLLARRAKNDRVFQSLWAGNIAGFNSSSEADLALCGKLAFYVGENPSAADIDALFRQSGLYRADKWDKDVGSGGEWGNGEKESYAQRTVRLAIENQGEYFGKKQSKHSGGDVILASKPVPAEAPQPAPKEDAPKPESAPAASDEDEEPENFFVGKQGLFYQSEEGSGASWISAPFRITARTRSPDTGAGWSKLLEFTAPDGTAQRWAMPMRELSGTEYVKVLYDMGLDIATHKVGRQLLSTYIQKYKPAKLIDVVNRTGWHSENGFVLPDESMGTAAMLETISAFNPYKTQGTLQDWQEQTASLCVDNSRLIFGVCAAFASPLLHLTAEENGGFNLRGSSSEGKTVSLKMAASVWGKSDQYIQRWRATAVGIEQTAVTYNDALLCLDELGQVDPSTAGEVAYMLANGQGKLRGARTGGLRTTEKWRLLFLSSGEISLAQHMAERDKRARAGQELRLADIPSNAGKGLGSFEDLHGQDSGNSFAKHCVKQANQHYGTAGRGFIKALQHDIDSALKFLIKERETFDQHIPDNAAGQVSRVARRFGLVAAAGELASHLGITGWEKGTASKGVLTCMQAWLKARGTHGQRETQQAIEQVRAFLQQHGASRFEPWNGNRTPIQNRAGFQRNINGAIDYYIFPSVFKSEICNGLDYQLVASVLFEKGWLIATTNKDGTFKSATRPERLPFMGNVRVYRVSIQPENSVETESEKIDVAGVAVWQCGKCSRTKSST